MKVGNKYVGASTRTLYHCCGKTLDNEHIVHRIDKPNMKPVIIQPSDEHRYLDMNGDMAIDSFVVFQGEEEILITSLMKEDAFVEEYFTDGDRDINEYTRSQVDKENGVQVTQELKLRY